MGVAIIRRDHALRLLRDAARFGGGTSWGRAAVEGELEFGLCKDTCRRAALWRPGGLNKELALVRP